MAELHLKLKEFHAVYPSISLYVNSVTCKSIDSPNFKFIWKNKGEHVSRKSLTQLYSKEGLNVLDFYLEPGF